MGYLGNNVKCDSYRCRWFIGNKHLWTTLNNYGCTPRKSLTLKFPDKTIFKSKDLIRHFIRGYFDGDGCVTLQKNKYSIRPYVSIIGTWEFLNSIEHYLNYPTLAKIYKDKRSQKNTYTLWFKTIESFDFLDKVYENATIYLNRKYNRYLQTILPF
jgi:intein/homing endonuclease